MPETKLLTLDEVDELSLRDSCCHGCASLTTAERDALCATVRGLEVERNALKDELKVADDALETQVRWITELRDQLAAAEQERDALRECLAEEIASRVNVSVTRMEQSQKVSQAEIERHCNDDRLPDACRGSYQD